MLQKVVREVYLFDAFVGGWVNRQRGRIVAVEIMIVIVLLSGGGDKNSLEWICAAGGRRSIG